MLFLVCFPLFRSYIARYAPLKNEKSILKKTYKNFKDINLNSFYRRFDGFSKFLPTFAMTNLKNSNNHV